MNYFIISSIIIILIYLVLKKSFSSINDKITKIESSINNISNMNDKVNIMENSMKSFSSVNDKITLMENSMKSFSSVNDKITLMQSSMSNISNVNDKIINIENLYSNISNSVRELDKIFNNNKFRGNIGENLLEFQLKDLLSTTMYEKEYELIDKVDNQKIRVDFVIKIPKKDGDNGYILLPIDSKFNLPNGDLNNSEVKEDFKNNLKTSLKNIKKYITDETTDFAIMYIPSELLYLEIYANKEYTDLIKIADESKIIITGPSTIMAIIRIIQMAWNEFEISKKNDKIHIKFKEFISEFERLEKAWENETKEFRKAQKNLENCIKEIRKMKESIES